jgi:o-succinylbenzoate synthase
VRVAAARLRSIGGPLPVEIRTRAVAWQARYGVLLELADEDGTAGVGEASPLPGYSSDDLADCEFALRSWTARLPLSLDLSGTVLGQVASLAEAIPGELPAARMALETALLDLAAKRLGISVAELLAGGTPQREVPLAVLLFGRDAATLAAEVDGGLALGVRTFKLKVGGHDFAGELELIRSLRRAVAGDWALRLDANAAWTPEVARQRLRALAGLGVELVEQPVGPELLPELTGSPVALAADETMRLPDALERLAASRACTAVVLKPMVLGGLSRCLALARAAHGAGLGVVVTHLFDGPVAVAAACELALAIGTPLACGLAPHPALGVLGRGLPGALQPDRVAPHDGSGLGIRGDP